MITPNDLISIGIIRRTHYDDLPPFVFVLRDGLFVPYRSDRVSELIGMEAFVLRSDMAEEEEEGLMAWQDLVGYRIEDTEEGIIGEIEWIDESTINTLATLTDGRMIPLHEDFILDINTATRIIRVNLPFKI